MQAERKLLESELEQ